MAFSIGGNGKRGRAPLSGHDLVCKALDRANLSDPLTEGSYTFKVSYIGPQTVNVDEHGAGWDEVAAYLGEKVDSARKAQG